MTRERPSVRRYRHLLGRRRWDRGTTLILAVLVVASLVLDGMIFLQPNTAPLVQEGPGAVYHTPDAQLGQPTPEDVIVPDQLALLYGGAFGDVGMSTPGGGTTGAADFRVVWQAVLQVLDTVTVGQLAGARQIGFKPVADALAALSTLPAIGGATGVDASLPYRISWVDLLTAAGAAPPKSSPSPTFDRVVLLSTTPGGGGPELLLLAGATAVAVPLTTEQFSGLGDLLTELRGHVAGRAYELRPLNATGHLPAAVAQAVAAPQAVLVPFGFFWQPVALETEPLNAQALAAAIFPDPLDVALANSHGAQIFTNSQDWLLTVGPSPGAATFFRTAIRGSGAPAWYVGLRQVLAYVYRAGGWPASVWLAGFSKNSGTCLVACAVHSRQYSFSVDAGGLPVLEPPGSSALAVTLTGASGQPTSYARDLPIAGGVEQVFASPIAATTAAAVALRHAAAGDTEIVRIFPAMAPRPSLGALRPVWAVELANPAGGASQTVLIDAYTGAPLSGAQGGA